MYADDGGNRPVELTEVNTHTMQQVKETTHDDLMAEYAEKRKAAIARSQDVELSRLRRMKANDIGNSKNVGNYGKNIPAFTLEEAIWNCSFDQINSMIYDDMNFSIYSKDELQALYDKIIDLDVRNNAFDNVKNKRAFLRKLEKAINSTTSEAGEYSITNIDDLDSAETKEELLLMIIAKTDDEYMRRYLLEQMEIGKYNGYSNITINSLEPNNVGEGLDEKDARDAAANLYDDEEDWNKFREGLKITTLSTIGGLKVGGLKGAAVGFLGGILVSLVNTVVDVYTDEGAAEPGMHYEFDIQIVDIETSDPNNIVTSSISVDSARVTGRLGPYDEGDNRLNWIEWLHWNTNR